MFFRIKPSGPRRYLQIVENVRDGAKTKQSVLCTLGRVDELEASGKLDVLLRSGARHCETAMLVSGLREGTLEAVTSERIGGPMIFGRLWEETGCRKLIEDLIGARGFTAPLERAIFATVLHRLMVSGSDRACERWLEAYRIEGAEKLELHHLYRAMSWLGEPLADQRSATRGVAPDQGRDRGTAVRTAALSVLRPLGRAVRHHVIVLLWRGRTDVRPQRQVQGPSAGPQAGDRWRGARCQRSADLLGDL